MSDYDDYENNLAFPPEGDWADTNPRANTDRTASTIELVNKIEELNKWLDLKSEYIFKLENENTKLKDLLKESQHIMKIEKDFSSCHFEKAKLEELLTKIDEVLK